MEDCRFLEDLGELFQVLLLQCYEMGSGIQIEIEMEKGGGEGEEN